jgi:hypothetical protein
MEVSNSDDDNGNGARTWASSRLHTTVTGIVQTTFIYDQVCDLLSGNSAIVWSPRGRFWCSGWAAHQKKIVVTVTRFSRNTWTRPMY